jgi:hypothetical protein
MAVQARRVQIIIACNMIARLTRSEPSVNFSAFDMLTCCCIFLSRYSPYFLPLIKKGRPGGAYARNIPLCESHPATISGRPSHSLLNDLGLVWLIVR